VLRILRANPHANWRLVRDRTGLTDAKARRALRRQEADPPVLSLAKLGRGREDYHLRAVGADASEYYSEHGGTLDGRELNESDREPRTETPRGSACSGARVQLWAGVRARRPDDLSRPRWDGGELVLTIGGVLKVTLSEQARWLVKVLTRALAGKPDGSRGG
jgi:hypothetical protein